VLWTANYSKSVADGAMALIDELYAYFEQEMSGGATAMLWPDNMTPEARMIWEDLEQAKPR
jgi:hypothetical protein